MSLNANQAAASRDQLLAKLHGEHEAMGRVIEHLPDDKLGYKPHESLRSFAELSDHIYGVGHWFAHIMETGEVDLSGDGGKSAVPSDKNALKDGCNRMNEEVVGRMKALSGEQLAKEIAFLNFGSFPAVTFLDWHISHLIHHRGQLTTYLRLMGAKVPQIYGDSKDYPM